MQINRISRGKETTAIILTTNFIGLKKNNPFLQEIEGLGMAY